MPPVIKTPQPQSYRTSLGTVTLTWGRTMPERWTKKIGRAEKAMGKKILQLSKPYIPKDTGYLISSGEVVVRAGLTFVEWGAPYARWQYFSTRPVGSRTGPLRGPYWYHRMRATHKNALVEAGKKEMRK